MNKLSSILLSVMILTVTGCRKEERINPYNPNLSLTQKYTPLLGNARLFTVRVNEYSVVEPKDTIYALNDISFKIDVINDTTIKVLGHVLNYVLDDTSTNLYYLKTDGPDLWSIRYYYKRDSVEYFSARSTPTETVSYTYNSYSAAE